MKTRRFVQALFIAGSLMLLVGATEVLAQDILPDREDVQGPKKEYSPYVEDHFPNRVFFGDTHLHTSWSTARCTLSGSARRPYRETDGRPNVS